MEVRRFVDVFRHAADYAQSHQHYERRPLPGLGEEHDREVERRSELVEVSKVQLKMHELLNVVPDRGRRVEDTDDYGRDSQRKYVDYFENPPSAKLLAKNEREPE